MGIIDLPGVRLRFSRQKPDDLTRERSWPAVPDRRWKRAETPAGRVPWPQQCGAARARSQVIKAFFLLFNNQGQILGQKITINTSDWPFLFLALEK